MNYIPLSRCPKDKMEIEDEQGRAARRAFSDTVSVWIQREARGIAKLGDAGAPKAGLGGGSKNWPWLWTDAQRLSGFALEAITHWATD